MKNLLRVIHHSKRDGYTKPKNPPKGLADITEKTPCI